MRKRLGAPGEESRPAMDPNASTMHRVQRTQVGVLVNWKRECPSTDVVDATDPLDPLIAQISTLAHSPTCTEGRTSVHWQRAIPASGYDHTSTFHVTAPWTIEVWALGKRDGG